MQTDNWYNVRLAEFAVSDLEVYEDLKVRFTRGRRDDHEVEVLGGKRQCGLLLRSATASERRALEVNRAFQAACAEVAHLKGF